MRILIDIGHPGHVHYFRRLIKNLMNQGHNVYITARNRDIIFDLLTYYNIPFYSRGKGSNSKLGKFFYLIKADFILLYYFLRKRIDLSISFSTGYPSHIGWLLCKPTISLNDTEHTNKIHKKFVYPFSSLIITPNVFYENLGIKHLIFKGFMEGFYLYSNYFNPGEEVLDILNIKENEKFIILRFVSWNAHHDSKKKGLKTNFKIRLVRFLEQFGYKIFISSENNCLPNELVSYKLPTPIHLIHSVLYFAEFVISESGTMASESAYLGTHVIYTNPLPLMGYLREEKSYGLLFHELEDSSILKRTNELIKTNNLKKTGRDKARRMKINHIDSTEFLSSIINNIPNRK